MNSVENPLTESIEGEGKPRRHPLFKELIGPAEGLETLHDLLLQTVKTYGNNQYLGKRIKKINGSFGSYEWQTYNEVFEQIKAISSFLMFRNIKQNDCIGLFSINRSEWVVTEQACYRSSLIVVPLYDTLGDEAIEYIIKKTEISILFTTSEKCTKLLQSNLNSKTSILKLIVIMDEITVELNESWKDSQIEIISFDDALECGDKHPKDRCTPKSNDVATICFTSGIFPLILGTTGMPKGVIMTHFNVLSFVNSLCKLCNSGLMYQFSSADIYISYLPLAHSKVILKNSDGEIGISSKLDIWNKSWILPRKHVKVNGRSR